MIRIWREGTGAAESELRMQVQHVMSGEIHFFREWEALTIYLHDKVDRLEDETCDDAGGA